LRSITRVEAEERVGEELCALRTNSLSSAAPVGVTDTLLMASNDRFYPVVDDIPILLAPEAIGAASDKMEFDLEQPAFHEAYLEMDFYNQVSNSLASDLDSSTNAKEIRRAKALTQEHAFPAPEELWVDATHDTSAQADGYRELGALDGKDVLQIGGKGQQAVKLLVAGAANAWLVTPMVGEAHFALQLARYAGVEDRFNPVVGVAEQLPLIDTSVDAIFSIGCVHHFSMPEAMPEVYRVLTPGGAFAAVEPFRAPMYDLGTKILGKREANAFCYPMTPDRIAPIAENFDSSSVIHHGTFLRYLLIAASKVGVNLPPSKMLGISKADDWIADRLHLRNHGSSVALIGRKSA